ncbi:hypothetical protein ILUMI_16769, partial [Ignelater luminosus]
MLEMSTTSLYLFFKDSDASKIIKNTTASPTQENKSRIASRQVSQKEFVRKHTPAEALYLYVEISLTKQQYEVLRESNRNIHPEVLDHCTQEEIEYVKLVTIWVCDGSQQSQFQQTFFDIPSDDSNIFHSSLAILQLQVNIRSHKNILWQNPTPSSTRFCRPIRIRFLHEIVDITKKEIKYVEDQAKDLKKTEILTSNGVIYVRHTLLPTIVDAK